MQKNKTFIVFFIIFMFLLNFSAGLNAKKSQKKHRKSYKYNKKYNVYHPGDYKIKKPKLISYKEEFIILDFYSKGFSQGQIIYLEIRKKNNSDKELNVKKIVFQKKSFKFTRHDYGFRSFIPIHSNMKPGMKDIVIEYEIGGKELISNNQLKINKSKFIFNRRPMDLGKYSDVDFQETPENIAFIKKCTLKKRKAFSSISSDKITNVFAHPRDYHYVTSPFWARRTIMQYKIRNKKKIRLKNRIKVHRGLDLRGEKGESVYSIADGRVVLAEEMFYEGNFLIIDHGNKIFSYYMHLDKIEVQEGDIVKAGQKVARVGSTGVSTAAHLHVSFMIQGIQVHPLSLLGLPIRN